jgi:Tol biopolymer transport system component
VGPELSPDGGQLAIQRTDSKTRNSDLWVIDLARGAFRRLTTDPGFDQLPVWTPDGRSLFFTRQNLRRIALDGSADELVLTGSRYPKSVSPDGRFLIYAQRGETTRADIWALPLSGSGTVASPVPLLRSEFDDDQPQISPDGRWLAYCSDLTGRREIYVRPFLAAAGGTPALGEATLVSAQGGMLPRWRHDGTELFYIEAPVTTSEGDLMAVALRTRDGRFDFDAAVPLFQTAMVPNASSAEYAVALDGRRFVVGTVVERAASPPVSLVLNWTADMPH